MYPNNPHLFHHLSTFAVHGKYVISVISVVSSNFGYNIIIHCVFVFLYMSLFLSVCVHVSLFFVCHSFILFSLTQQSSLLDCLPQSCLSVCCCLVPWKIKVPKMGASSCSICSLMLLSCQNILKPSVFAFVLIPILHLSLPVALFPSTAFFNISGLLGTQTM